MMKRYMILAMALLALTMLATSGCKTKKPGTSIDPTALTADDRVITGYDEFGNPIYADGVDMGALTRTDGTEINAGQFEAVYFDYDSPQLNPAEQGKIDAVIAYLQANPALRVVVEGHCDERGSNEYNLTLSERRALAVRASMVSLGIDGTRIETRSYGEERPVAFGHDDSAWRLNRRAEFVFTQM